jgi:catechol 2,3-dioxygenase-like lactoylglutathione lyase family enzyme
MPLEARYAHTNIVAHDWQRLAAFYCDVFGCVPVPPERDLAGRWLEAGTGVPGARIRGIHLRLPGVGPSGPTLEILQYEQALDAPATAANRPGYGHIAFATNNDMAEAHAAVLAAGGRAVGRIVSAEVTGAGTITFVYMADPEGNIVEIQSHA